MTYSKKYYIRPANKSQGKRRRKIEEIFELENGNRKKPPQDAQT